MFLHGKQSQTSEQTVPRICYSSIASFATLHLSNICLLESSYFFLFLSFCNGCIISTEVFLRVNYITKLYSSKQFFFLYFYQSPSISPPFISHFVNFFVLSPSLQLFQCWNRVSLPWLCLCVTAQIHRTAPDSAIQEQRRREMCPLLHLL